MADILPAGTFSPEITARINDLAQEGFNDWKANATAEQKAAGIAQHEKFLSDPEFGAAEMARCAEMWGASDTNADGLLNEAEFLVMSQKQRDHAASTGNYAAAVAGWDSKLWAICNETNPATAAVSMTEYFGVIGVVMQKWEEFKQSM